MKRITALLLTLVLGVSMIACGAPAQEAASAADTVSAEETAAVTETTTQAEGTEASEETAGEQAARPVTDPSGAAISVPENIETVAVLAPSIAQTLLAMGYGDKIVAYDTQSLGLEGIPECDVVMDLMQPDMEQLAVLKPDVLFVSNLSLYDQEAPYQQLIDLGVCVICIPTSDSLADIQSDITFLASVFGAPEKGEEIVSQMQAEIDRISQIGKTITEKKKVYFEIAAAPAMYSFGSGVYLNEMIELIGAENILAGEEGWMSVEPETVVAANPDVILTNVTYVENPTQEIMGRDGWNAVTAVTEEAVYSIDNFASSLANENVVKALVQMAEAVYPEYYSE